MIDQIILSCNEDPTYSSFWEPVSFAYKKMFPDAVIHLAFLTDKEEDDPMVVEFRKHGKVTLFKKVSGFSEFSQAKMIRFILASEQGNDVCYIDDIDLFPLTRDFITSKTKRRPKDHLLCVGGEVYNNNGCYPVSQMTAEGYVWKNFINSLGLHRDMLFAFYSGPWRFDRREDMKIETDWAKDDYFSDERLLRRLLFYNPVPKLELRRGYHHYLDATIDRAAWNLDMDKLNRHGYFNAHCCRPYNSEQMEPLIDYINRNYG